MKSGYLSALLSKALGRNFLHSDCNVINASNLYECPRKIWYALKNNGLCSQGASETFKIYLSRKIKESTVLCMKINDSYVDFKVIMPEGSNINLMGHDRDFPWLIAYMDAVVQLPDNTYIGLLVKSASHASFQKFKSKGVQAWSPSAYSVAQCLFNMHFFYEISQVRVLVIDRETYEMHDEEVRRDDFIYDLDLARAKRLYGAEKEPAKVNESPLWHECKLCQFRGICHTQKKDK